jgi:hypothetical protein
MRIVVLIVFFTEDSPIAASGGLGMCPLEIWLMLLHQDAGVRRGIRPQTAKLMLDMWSFGVFLYFCLSGKVPKLFALLGCSLDATL